VISGVTVLLASAPGEEVDIPGFVFCVPESFFLRAFKLEVADVRDFVDVQD